MKKQQAGISLFIVMVVVLLTAILVAMGFRSSQFNEAVIGNTAEYQRLYEAAQALVHDAELDIRGITATGSACVGVGCREYMSIDETAGKIYFPLNTELPEVRMALRFASHNCIAGICGAKESGVVGEEYWATLWKPANVATLDAMKSRAGHYGQYTKGGLGAGTNPRLSNANGWYWVEILDYDVGSGLAGGTEMAPTDDSKVIYRITALAEGVRNQRAVVQKVVVGKGEE